MDGGGTAVGSDDGGGAQMKTIETQISLEDINDEYKVFVEKFKPKKTTDDCYTPENIYETVKEWACNEYGINPEKIVRPFWPGGDYECYPYKDGDVVLDNPPFSIIGQIVKFYNRYEAKQMAIKILEQEPCDNCISRQAAIDAIRKDIMGGLNYEGILTRLPPVTPQTKMGCEGCIYEKTGNNSTYPCSHCSRCYTDKYKVENEG